MFSERVHLKIGVPFYHVYYDGPPGDYVTLLGFIVEVGEGANDVGAEPMRLLVHVKNEHEK